MVSRLYDMQFRSGSIPGISTNHADMVKMADTLGLGSSEPQGSSQFDSGCRYKRLQYVAGVHPSNCGIIAFREYASAGYGV